VILAALLQTLVVWSSGMAFIPERARSARRRLCSGAGQTL